MCLSYPPKPSKDGFWGINKYFSIICSLNHRYNLYIVCVMGVTNEMYKQLTPEEFGKLFKSIHLFIY